MTTKLTDLRNRTESSKNVKPIKSKNVKEEKQQVTLHLPLDVVEHLMLGKARRQGSMSDQVTKLVRNEASKIEKLRKEETG